LDKSGNARARCGLIQLAWRFFPAIEDVNQQPVVHTWSYKLESAA
jgi:hypothetical protein